MSRGEDLYQARRWLDTAAEDLRAVQTLLEAGLYAQACFMAQQCGEKAVKALWYAIDADPWGHSIQRLVSQCPLKERMSQEEWVKTAALLDRFYIPTRYPNGLPDLTPGQTYFRQDAEQALERAGWLLEACRCLLETLSTGRFPSPDPGESEPEEEA